MIYFRIHFYTNLGDTKSNNKCLCDKHFKIRYFLMLMLLIDIGSTTISFLFWSLKKNSKHTLSLKDLGFTKTIQFQCNNKKSKAIIKFIQKNKNNIID